MQEQLISKQKENELLKTEIFDLKNTVSLRDNTITQNLERIKELEIQLLEYNH